MKGRASSSRKFRVPNRCMVLFGSAFICFFLLAAASGLLWAGVVCHYPGDPTPGANQWKPLAGECRYDATNEITWPSQWKTVNATTESTTDGGGTGNPLWEIIGSSTCPGIYYAQGTINGSAYMFFRVRLANSTAIPVGGSYPYVSSNSGTYYFYINTDLTLATLYPRYSFSWDNAGVSGYDNQKHGLEMQVPDSPPFTQWLNVKMDDYDGSNNSKLEKDFDGLPGNATPDFRNREGYVRTVDSVSCGGGTHTFVDIAVKCAYFSRTNVGLPNLCDYSFYIQVAAQRNNNDHGALISGVSDVAGGVTAISPTIIASHWGTAVSPTQAVISSFSAYAHGGQVVASWETASEVGTAGFYLYRVDPQTGSRTKLNNAIIPGLIESPHGGRYYVVDEGATPGEELTYVLEEIESRGSIKTYGPYTVLVKKSIDDGAIANSLAASGYARIGSAPTRSLSASKAPAARASTQQIGLSKGVKIGVKEPGLYRVEAADIAKNMNVPSMIVRGMIAANNFQLSNRGQPVSVKAAPDNKALYFYGEAIDSIYTDTNVYVLTAGRGASMATVKQPSLSPNGGGDSFVDTLHIEKNLVPATALFFDPEEDYWFWDFMVAGNASLQTKNFSFRADGVVGPGQLAVNLFGYTNSGKADEHHARVSLNGSLLGDTHWTGATPHTAVFPVPDGVLLDGDNVATVTAVLDAGIPQSLFAVDSFDLTYERAYRAYGDQLLLAGDGNPDVTVDGFSSKNIWVLDLADPQHPAVLGKTTTGGGPGNYWVQFTPASPDRPYLAAALAGAKKPSSLEPVPLIGLKTGARGVDYLIITAPELSKAASELASLRSRKGLKTAVVTVDQIYDDFSSSIVNPHAITAFLKHVSTVWKPAPRFVVFAGSGSIDYKNVKGFGDSLVPTVMTSTPYGLFPADGRLVDIKGNDDVPDLPVGRIPALSEAELRAYATKLARYEAASGDWKTKVLFVADNPDDAGNFPVDKEEVAGLVPSWLNIERIYMPPLDAVQARANLLAGIKNGALAVNYLGHSGYEQLAGEGLLATADIPTLGNGSKLPVFTAMTCMVNHFAWPGQTYLGQKIVNQNDGGGIAIWAPTGLLTNDDSKPLDAALWQRLFLPQTRSFGEAVTSVLQEQGQDGTAPYVLQTYTILGDPAIWLKR